MIICVLATDWQFATVRLVSCSVILTMRKRRGRVTMKTDFYIEFEGKQVSHKMLTDRIKAIWKADGNTVKSLQSLEIYYKPQENACYYVINDTITGNFHV